MTQSGCLLALDIRQVPVARLFFVHFWANDALKLAKGVQAALEKMAVARS